MTKLQETGDSFKRVTIAHGEHFNDLNDSPYKQAIAKAMVITQISLRLAGFNTDLDRHGGNIKVQGNTITHFDFGAMNTTPLTTEDKKITGQILAEAVIAVSKGKDFTKTLLNRIQNAVVSDASRIYLNGLNKDFLALGDYLHIIEKDALANLLAKCLIAKTVDPEISAAFTARLGLLHGILIQNALKYRAQRASAQVFLRPMTKSESRVSPIEITKITSEHYNDIYRLLEGHDWDINAGMTTDGSTLLDIARANHEEKLEQLFLKMGAHSNPTVDGFNNVEDDIHHLEFMDAIKNGNIHKVKEMLSNGFAYSSRRYRGAIVLAVESKSFDVVQCLVEQGEQLSAPVLQESLQINYHHPWLSPIIKFFELEKQKQKQKQMIKAFCDAKGKLTDCIQEIEQIEKEFKKQVQLIRAEHAIRFSHINNVGFIDLTEDDISKKNNHVIPLIKRIDSLKKYGEKLKKEDHRGAQQVINLALNLQSEVCCYVDGKMAKEEATHRIDALMQQGKLMMRDHHRAQDILGHILLALTGIGIILMMKQKMCMGTFFLNKTKRERLLSNVDEEITNNCFAEDYGRSKTEVSNPLTRILLVGS